MAVEGKGGAGGFREGETGRKRGRQGDGGDRGIQRKRKWKEDETEPHGLEKLQVARDLIAGEENCVVVNVPNLGVQRINIITELCVPCSGLLRLEISCSTVQQLHCLVLTVNVTT